MNRRSFLGGVLATGTALAATPLTATETNPPSEKAAAAKPAEAKSGNPESAIDFRYAPVQGQTAICFPDDKHKSLVNESGRLLYEFKNDVWTLAVSRKVSFGLEGMHQAFVALQELESAAIPIVHTLLVYPGATVELIAFATNETGEGRVDNVILEATPYGEGPVNLEPGLEFETVERFDWEVKSDHFMVMRKGTREVLLVGRGMESPQVDEGHGGLDRYQRLVLHRGVAAKAKPYRAFYRLPLERQNAEMVAAGLKDMDGLLGRSRAFWREWKAFKEPAAIEAPGRTGEFVEACARNILQAREMRDGKLTFQVGPTCYRGLWVVDGNFILEAARYMGYDKDALEGMRTTWSKQEPSGQIVAGAGKEHWKDTAIALFTLVRQCELGQDWTPMRELEPQAVKALEFIEGLEAAAVKQGSALGRYGLLPKGMADGGIGGVSNEFTNTVWTLAGLKALAEAAEKQKMERLARARGMYDRLKAAFAIAATQEMKRYPAGFEYLPMLLKDDPEWKLADEWDRPRPQSAQWALSHAIFPGRVFTPEDPIVRGHVKLMQAVVQEGIPAETGWMHHEAVWTYNAPFVAEVYLWLGMRQAALDTFAAFLNHASPQYCWREEQPLKNSLMGEYTGDMPHNWASAECIRYVRHMLALEDGGHLRLLEGVTEGVLAARKPWGVTASPTRFGRVSLRLEPLDRAQGWRMKFERSAGPAPQKVSVPAKLGRRAVFAKVEGAKTRIVGETMTVDPAAAKWSATWMIG